MALLKTVLDAFEDKDAKPDELIKTGTLRTTRATALVVVSVFSIMLLLDEYALEVTWIADLTPYEKFSGSIAIGFIWAITAAADSISRGIATSKTAPAAQPPPGYAVAMHEITRSKDLRHGFRAIDPPLDVVLKDKLGKDENGWLVVAAAITRSGCEFCCVKGDVVEWRRWDDEDVIWSVPRAA